MDVFGKVVVFGQQWLYRVKLLYSCTSGYIQAKWLCLGKSVCVRGKWLYSGKVVVFGQKCLYLGKVVVFG